MSILIIGSGPVGLATADLVSQTDVETLLMVVGPLDESPQPRLDQKPKAKATYPAAAAFWTPFWSGVSAEKEMELSIRTLEFYEELKSVPAAGVHFRSVEQYWVRGERWNRDWSQLAQLDFKRLPHGDAYIQSGDELQFRCEFSYTAPVIHVDTFRTWYLNHLGKRSNVKIITWPHPFTKSLDHQPQRDAWQRFFDEHAIDRVILCTGAATTYFGLHDASQLDDDAIQYKKGVVGIVRCKTNREDSILLYEGGPFDVDALYLVPHRDYYVVGGTLYSASAEYDPADWQITETEKSGILNRARSFLPADRIDQLERVRFWDDGQVEWRVGVRPHLHNHGPYCASSPEIGDLLSQLCGREIEVFTHFGHGGSGFTFSHDTAQLVVDQIV